MKKMIPLPPFDDNTYVWQGKGWKKIRTYEDYARMLYSKWGQNAKFPNAWEHSLTVDPLEISANSVSSNPRGKAQYPNGTTEGVIIPDGVTSIGNYAFTSWTTNNQPLVIPNSIASISDYAFSNWQSNNQPLVIPNSVTSIGVQAFFNWRANNQPLVIPDSVTSIGVQAFYNWSSNDQPLVIPNSVTSIGVQAFYNWNLVPYVEIKAVIPPSLSSYTAFANQNNAPIYVPDESVNAYKTATNWVDLASRIFPISEKP